MLVSSALTALSSSWREPFEVGWEPFGAFESVEVFESVGVLFVGRKDAGGKEGVRRLQLQRVLVVVDEPRHSNLSQHHEP